MPNENVVNPELTTQQPVRSPNALEDIQQKAQNKEDLATKEVKQEPAQAPEAKEEDSGVEPEQNPKAGDKTDPNLLLKSLQEERERRRADEARMKELESEIELLKTSSSSDEDEVYSDEGKALQKEIKEAKEELAALKKESAKKDLLLKHPILSDHLSDFEEFQNDPENKGMNLNTAAKAFMVEKGLLDSTRKGLERPTGGDKVPASTGKMSHADAENLRKTNFRKYQDMLMKGQLQLEK